MSLVELVHCQQTFPYVSFMSQTLADHSYVDISQVGMTTNNVQCHTDLMKCCSGVQGVHRGDWYFPAGDRLQFSDSLGIVQRRQDRTVLIRRNSGTEPTGIYRCEIPTVAAHAMDNSVRVSVYVGLYPSDGGKVL